MHIGLCREFPGEASRSGEIRAEVSRPGATPTGGARRPPSGGGASGAALALTLGIDSIVVMKDVCRLDDDEALAVLRWAATVLLRAGLEEGRAPASVR